MHSTRSRLFLVVVGTILAIGCSGGSSGGGHTQPQGKLSIAYTALTAKVGDQVALTAQLENASGEVAWSLDGVGALSAASGTQIAYQASAAGTASVTAAVADLTATVTIKVVPGGGIVGGSSSSSGGGGGCVDPTITTSTGCVDPTITVTGLVLNVNGYPVENQAIFVLGMPGPATSTDVTGHFTIAGVSAPYDLGMVVDATNSVYVYRGLTRTDPTLYVNIQDDQTVLLPWTTTLRGDTFGGDATPAPDLQGVGFVSPAVNRTLNLFDQTSTLPTIPGPYQLDLLWSGPIDTTGTLVGVQVRPDPGTGAPLDYWYAAQPNVTLLGNQPFLLGPSLTFMPVATANTEGDITLAPNYQIQGKFMGLSFEDGVFFIIYNDFLSIAQPSFKYIAPDIAHTTTQVCAWAANTVPSLPGESITCLDALKPESRGAVLEILAAPQPYAPANTANAVTASTPFSWSPFTGGVYGVRIAPVSPQSNPTYYIFTAGTSTTVPDVGLVGLAFGGGSYEWDVTGFAPFADLDAFTAEIPAAATFLLNQGKVPPVANASVGFGQTYTFSH